MGRAEDAELQTSHNILSIVVSQKRYNRIHFIQSKVDFKIKLAVNFERRYAVHSASKLSKKIEEKKQKNILKIKKL